MNLYYRVHSPPLAGKKKPVFLNLALCREAVYFYRPIHPGRLGRKMEGGLPLKRRPAEGDRENTETGILMTSPVPLVNLCFRNNYNIE